MISSSQIHICDVCRLLDFDTSKKLCGFCGMCDAFICDACLPNWPRRIKAAIKRKLEPGYKGLNDYVEKAQEGLKNEPSANS